MTKLCAWCGVAFFADRGRKIYCCSGCQEAAKQKQIQEYRARERGEKFCAVCGETLLPYQRKYCSEHANKRIESYRRDAPQSQRAASECRLIAVNAAARCKKMSYGRYMAALAAGGYNGL